MNIEYYREQLLAKEDMLARTTSYLLDVQKKLMDRNNLISGINRGLFESIGFANIIQTALLPDTRIMEAFVNEAAYQVVNQIGIGGDSVLIRELKDGICFGLLDATGHGIPAAMLSISGMLIMNELFAGAYSTTPEALMDGFSERLYRTFNRERSIAHFEGIICLYAADDQLLSYCSARGKGMHISSTGELTDLSADRLPIGEQSAASYTLHAVKCQPGDKVLLYSDGLTDQFGGDRDKKFSKRRLKQLLREAAEMSAEELSTEIRRAHAQWQGDNEQTDDLSFFITTF